MMLISWTNYETGTYLKSKCGKNKVVVVHVLMGISSPVGRY